MSNIDTKVTETWGRPRPPRSTLTQISNEINQIRDWHNQEFQRVIRGPGGSVKALKLRVSEDAQIADALRRNGWTYGTLEAELLRRTTPRWSRYVIHGWF